MEEQNLNQYQDQNSEIVQARIQLSRDNKWIIIRLNIDDREISVIKPVAYFEKILQRAKSGNRNVSYNIEKIKG